MTSLRNKLGYVNIDQVSDNRGLSNTNKVQKVFLRNIISGEQIELDRNVIRLSKLRRRVFAWANTVKDYLPAAGKGRGFRKVMITLTYAPDVDWKANHIRDFIKELKRRLDINLVALAWVAELQERGAVHYHVMVIAKKGTRIPMPDKSGMWRYGMSKIETAKSVFYICSYLKKQYQKGLGDNKFPKGLRMYSVYVSKNFFSVASRWFLRLSTLPRWLYEVVIGLSDAYGSSWKRCKFGGWWYADKHYKSPFVLVGFD